MKQLKLSYPVIVCFLLSASITKAQPSDQLNVQIESIEDLKTAVDSSSFMDVISAMESWLPDVVSATQWEARISKNFMIHYFIDVNDEDDILFDSLIEKSEEIYDDLNEFFEIEAGSKQEILAQQTRLLCFIIKTRSRTTFGFLNDPHTFFFYLDTENTPNYMEKFRHEYAHWVWGRSFGEAPSFLWEGLATYAEKMSYPQSDVSNLMIRGISLESIPPLTECVKNEVFWSQKGMYTAGSQFVYYLVENWGWDKLKQLFLISDFEDSDIQEHFFQIYGFKLENLDKDWRAFLNMEFEQSLL